MATRGNVLIVDDDEDWRAVIADVLSEEGFSVSTANDGRAACSALRRSKPGVVVTDGQMPLMSGCELLAWLRSLDRTLPVIVVTAEDTWDIASTYVEAFRVIRKPTTADAIVSAVSEALLTHHEPYLRRVSRAAGAAAYAARHRAQALLSRTVSAPRPTKAAAAAAVECPVVSKRGRRGPGRAAALAAGFGVAAAAAVVIVAIRGLAA